MEVKITDLFIAYEDTPGVKFAAMELVGYIRKLTGHTVQSGTKGREGAFKVYLATCGSIEGLSAHKADCSALRFDGFILKSYEDSLLIYGKYPRSVSYGVYHLLENWGVRWLYPGSEGEFLPENPVFDFEMDILENPDFEIRGYMEGGSADFPDHYIKEVTELIDWSFKNKINSYMRHYPVLAKIPFADVMIPEIKKRNMLFEFGGHGTQDFVRRSLFEQNPELFRMQSGVRVKTGNFCVSNKDACKLIVDGVLGIFEANPVIDILRLWYEDLVDGGWCECDECRNLAPVEQVFLITNQIGAAVKEKYPDKFIDIIFYHDTLNCSISDAVPESNVLGFIAPRERCYAHAIDDSSCRRNKDYYYDAFKALADKFGTNAYIMEYYADMILFNKMATDFSPTIAGDLKAYHKLGINKINCLMFNKYSWWAYKASMFFYNRLCWNVDADISTKDYAAYLYGKNGPKMQNILDSIRETSRQIFQFCEYDILFDIRIVPAQSKDFYKKHLTDIEKAIESFDEMMKTINDIIEKETDRVIISRLEELRIILFITGKEAQATLCHNKAFYGCKYTEGLHKKNLTPKSIRCSESVKSLSNISRHCRWR
ncbi:MAG: DUF4838 domain-containing protein [Saccharofermentanales bacterium]